ncbi:MAG: chromate transporter [Lachnospirales bacterium]
MQKNLKFYITLFLQTFKISAFTFGGGYVIVSLMKKQFVDKLGWISEKEMLDFTAIAQSSPGAIAVNASILVGYKVGGWPGAFTAILGTILPPLILLTAISYVYTWFISIDAIRYIMQGMQAGVAAVICDVVYGLGASVWKESRGIALVTAVLSFILVTFLSVNVILIVIVCIIAGIVIYGKERVRHGNTP